MEYLDRGLVAMEANDGIYLSWRMLGVDSMNVGFNLYRNEEKNASLITGSSNYQEVSGTPADVYQVETVVAGESVHCKPTSVWPKIVAETEGKAPLAFKHIPYRRLP